MSCPCQILRPEGAGCRLEEYAGLTAVATAVAAGEGRTAGPPLSWNSPEETGGEKDGDLPILSGSSGTSAAPAAGAGWPAPSDSAAPGPCGAEEYESCPRDRCWLRQIAYLQQQAREELEVTLSDEEERQRHSPRCPYMAVRQFDGALRCQDRRYVLCGAQQGRMASELYTHAYCLAGGYFYLSCGLYFQAHKEQCPPEPGRQACGYFDPYSGRCMAQKGEPAVTENWRSLYCLPEAGRMTGFRDCPRYIRRQLSEKDRR